MLRLVAPLLVLLASTPPPAPAGEEEPTVARFRGDRRGAVSLTFDDGTPDHIDTALPLLQKHGIKGTFFIVTDSIVASAAEAPPPAAGKSRKVGWDEWRQAAALGHEIGNHTASHPKLTDVKNDRELERQVTASHQIIAERIGRAPLSFAYPFCASSPAIERLVLEKHLLARGYKPTYGSANFTVDGVRKHLDEAVAKQSWHVALIHGVGNAEEYGKLFAGLAARSGELWTDTYGTVGRYVRERERARLEVLRRRDGEITLRLTTPGLDDPRYDVPLTVLVPVGAGAREPSAARGVTALPATVAGGHVQVEVAPGAEEFSVRWKVR